MRNLNTVAEQLFNEIRGRYSSVSIGDADGNITNEPKQARFYEFDFKSGMQDLGKVSVTLDEESGVTIMYNNNFTENALVSEKQDWYNFLKNIRMFAKKRLLNFEVRDINKSNLTKRDYSYLAKNRSGDQTMAESKMYGSNKTSFQKIGNAKLSIKHTKPMEESESRTKNIGSIYIENNQGEKFKYPYKHLSGARALAMHVSEGGNPYDDFGKHITGLSEELSNLRKFKTYMGRSSVMAESLAEHMDIVNERIATIKKSIQNLQKESHYKQAFEEFVPIEDIEVPEDISANWIDQLTVKQFNEELKDVFPYIYNLVSENTKPEEITFEDIFYEAKDTMIKTQPGEDSVSQVAQRFRVPAEKMKDFIQDVIEVNGLDSDKLQPGIDLVIPAGYIPGNVSSSPRPQMRPTNNTNIGSTEIAPNGQVTGSTRGFNTESAIDAAFDKLLGQFADNFSAQVEGDTDEGNAYAHAVRQAKMNGAKKGDKIDHPDSDEDDIVIEKDKTPLGEFILSYFDRQTGQFPKGETAVLTSVEKDYGDQYVKPASQFIERLGQVYEKYQQKKLGQVNLDEAGAGDFESQFRRIQQRGGNVAVSIHGLLKDSGLDADQIMGFDPNVPSNRTKVNQFQQGNQEEVLQKAQQALGSAQGGQAQPAAGSAQGGQDLGNGFQKIKHPQYGDAILDTQSGSVIFVNAGKLRSPGKYAVLQRNGKIQTTNQLGPMSTQAMQDAGLGESQNLNRIQELAGLR
jgi:hypothetical protein